MAGEAVLEIIQGYLSEVHKAGIPVDGAVLFGSYARGDQRPDSDIDVLVLSSRFDRAPTHEDVSTLWKLRRRTDPRIEPIPAGTQEYERDRGSPIIEIARQEGIRIWFAPARQT